MYRVNEGQNKNQRSEGARPSDAGAMNRSPCVARSIASDAEAGNIFDVDGRARARAREIAEMLRAYRDRAIKGIRADGTFHGDPSPPATRHSHRSIRFFSAGWRGVELLSTATCVGNVSRFPSRRPAAQRGVSRRVAECPFIFIFVASPVALFLPIFI